MSAIEIPPYVKLDFLLVLLGLLTFGFVIQQSFGKEIPLPLPKAIILLTLIFVGATFFIFGLSEMLKNYKRDAELLELKTEIEKIRLLNELTKLRKLRD